MFRINLARSAFSAVPVTMAESDEFTVTGIRYPSGVESVTVANSRGRVEVLPFLGQMVWDAEFDGVSLRMDSPFRQPYPATLIEDTYGCFAFHSGLLAAGCPSPEDNHPLHGEFPCAVFDEAWLEIDTDSVAVSGRHEFVKGFGDHYEAVPAVRLRAGSAMFDIDLSVTNLSAVRTMPLQYMCHMNYAYSDGARMTQSLPDGAFALRGTVPAHVFPTPEWTVLNEAIRSGQVAADVLDAAQGYDPEIVFLADDLPAYGQDLEFRLERTDGITFCTRFSSADFPVATRWLLHNPDQRVASFVLPGTSRPEGFLAAKAAGTLIELAPGASRSFHVSTGITEEA
ncbi:aldose 1-epimerase family protein [Arthrobacter sp. zg-Y859]|uniref:Aldose 1-epimerase family protein n=1 Tax=Arthrobacter jinronghuae TaxID=2964609 RepID=A0ABT1NVX9_9MICC|nr:aldose 1-epimerase family protein [Arthrobacter jinronghuae]MCQ1950879.1 aldose 1-epimerase family protein [Arthrobacter jinronghuae]UWX79347.1 aldose 1-epimerase family protein [Arthrobacter jinronghuae]